MSLTEFDLIGHYFKDRSATQAGVVLGIGDDCAILDLPDGHHLAVSTDTLVGDVHFFADVDPYRLGCKALAVNLSDLAAMGATPKWVSLAITLPEVDAPWLAEFSRGFFEIADKFNVSLVGGDTTKGPLSITVSVKGIIPRGQALQRDHAVVGDLICVSGHLGDAGLGLACKLKKITAAKDRVFINALELTEPRIELGILLRGLASSCIDLSDGLTQDLKHILMASHCSAKLDLERLPLSDSLREEVQIGTLNQYAAYQYALTGGDDYELLFTISVDHLAQLNLLIEKGRIKTPIVTVIGAVTTLQTPLIELFDHHKSVSLALHGWDHFRQGEN
ncbi:thiamine-phosphate kinase [Psychromonas antarctica]|uniref:thiamine-phosphate kinase n=1 Tax=Psychromonas antarctica TaxID=67573 RepID=UPI001EE9490D|nr:thiamine-phosphate kinase [Psychromonas antarctica]MCG6200457.1 thiamine-phosphate kinase [Psychromonas antarctica]